MIIGSEVDELLMGQMMVVGLSSCGSADLNKKNVDGFVVSRVETLAVGQTKPLIS